MRGRLFRGDGVKSEAVEIHVLGEELLTEGPAGEERFSLGAAQVMLGGDRAKYVVFRLAGEERREVWLERDAVLWHLRQGGAPAALVAHVEDLLASDNRWKGLDMLGLIGCGCLILVGPFILWALKTLGWLAFM
jgi:hypothetical protein